MDTSDQATRHEENERARALGIRKVEGPVANGACYNCDAEIADGRRWCDAACRDEYQKSMRR